MKFEIVSKQDTVPRVTLKKGWVVSDESDRYIRLSAQMRKGRGKLVLSFCKWQDTCTVAFADFDPEDSDYEFIGQAINITVEEGMRLCFDAPYSPTGE